MRPAAIVVRNVRSLGVDVTGRAGGHSGGGPGAGNCTGRRRRRRRPFSRLLTPALAVHACAPAVSPWRRRLGRAADQSSRRAAGAAVCSSHTGQARAPYRAETRAAGAHPSPTRCSGLVRTPLPSCRSSRQRAFRLLPASPRSLGPPASAGPARRLIAAAIDYLILLSIDAIVVYFTFQIAGLPFSSWQAMPILPLALFLLMVKGAYFCVFTALGGQTVGKMATGIRVVAENDRDVEPARALQRTLAALASCCHRRDRVCSGALRRRSTGAPRPPRGHSRRRPSSRVVDPLVT